MGTEAPWRWDQVKIRWKSVAGFGLDDDGCSGESKPFADAIFQKSLERKMQFAGAVGEGDKDGRRDPALRQIVEPCGFARGRSGPLKIHFREEPVHLGGRH